MRLRDEQGMMAIGVALMLIVVLALFGGALWQYSMAEMKRVERTEQDMQALFLARAGAEAVMSVWLDPEQSRPELPISMDPIYYNPTVGLFSSPTRPDDYRGVVEVTIKKEDYVYDGEVTEVTVIQSVATVGSIARTARLMTYPHRYGHDLAWYSDETGRIYQPTTPARSAPGELVVMRTNDQETSIYIGSNTLSSGSSSSNRTILFSAAHLVFDSPLNLALSASNLRDGPNGRVNVALKAEVIFLHGLELAYLPNPHTNPLKYYSVVLEVPDGRGQYGSEIENNIVNGMISPGALYGEVYFDSSPVALQEFYWRAILGIGSVRHQATHSLGLSSKAFYFKNGTRLDAEEIYTHVSSGNSVESYFENMANLGLLVPIPEDAQLSREELEEIQPFFWNQ